MKNLLKTLPLLAFVLFLTACTKEQLTPDTQQLAASGDENLTIVNDYAQLPPPAGYLSEQEVIKVLKLDQELTPRNHNNSVLLALSNDASGNEVISFNRNSDQTIYEGGRFSTGGKGSGLSLDNQSSMALSAGGKFLYTVNPGSDDFSFFHIQNDGTLDLKGKIASGGERPVSIAVRNGLIYVLNAGGTGNITGFGFNQQGQLVQIPNSTRSLSSTDAEAAQIGFSSSGKVLVVTEKESNTISTFPVLASGKTSAIQTYTTAGTTPSGFVFGNNNNFLVSEAGGGQDNASTVSTYHVTDYGKVSLVDGPFTTNATAGGRVVMDKNKQRIFTSNTTSNNISSLNVSYSGKLSAANNGTNTVAMSGPMDAAMDKDSEYLYVLTKGSKGVLTYKAGTNGELTQIGMYDLNLSDYMTGLVAR